MRTHHGQFEAVLFDFDGTYADTAADMVAALNLMRAQRQHPPIPFEVARPYVSHGSRALVNLGFEDADEIQKRELIQEFLNTYEADVAIHTRPFTGIEEWIASLESRAIPGNCHQ